VWKGTVQAQVVLETQLKNWALETPTYATGTEYLIYASGKYPNSHYSVDRYCGRTMPLASAQEDLKLLGENKNPEPIGAGINTPTYTRNLTLGSSGSDVIYLQQFLESKSFLKMPQGVAKGYFGQLTRKSLADWQKSVGIIPASGYFGPITRATIGGHY
jgi:hypothetical protein